MLRDLLLEATRSLVHDRRFTGLAAALLAITLGTVTAVYAIVHAIVLRPFPFADQDRLVVIWQRDDRRALPVVEVAYGEMEDWRARSRSFKDLAVVGSVNWSLTLVGPAGSQSVVLSAVSASFLSVMGTSPIMGRGFQPADEEGPIPRVMMVSHGFWTRRFGGDSAIVGRVVPVKLDADGPTVPIEVVGVMPREFDYPRGADVWVPSAPLIRKYAEAFGSVETAMRSLRVFYVLGRLRNRVSVDDAARELSQVMRTTDTKGGPEPNSELVVTPIARYLLGPAGPVLWTLLGGAVLMLAIACANVAGLQVSRSARRQRTLAIRVALGASGSRLVLGALVESALVTACALIGAVAVAYVTARSLLLLAPAGVPRLEGVGLITTPVLMFGATAAFVTILVCGFWPALAARHVDAVGVLAHGSVAAADPRGRRVQRAVVVAQVATALTLLAGMALFLRTLHGLDRTSLGFNPNQLLAISVTPATDDLARWNAFYEAVLERVQALPHVIAAGAVALRPLSGPIGWDSQPMFPGQIRNDPASWGLNPHTNLEVVTPGYFRAMQTRLVRGRLFTTRDTSTSPGAVVVSESAARRLWPGQDALGQQLRDPSYRTDAAGSDLAWQTVIGIVEDIRYRGLNAVRLDLYLPATQSTNRVQQLMIRTRGNPADVVASVRAVAREIDPGAGVSEATIMSEVVAAESAPWRFLMQVFFSFAALAATLAAVGLGAIVALAVAERRRELAIRAALGADRRRLRATVMREGLPLVGVGIGVGLLGAVALGRAVSHLLVGVAPHDLVALGAAVCLSAASGMLATWAPARRAVNVDPAEALRTD
jgi:putative ABC transport system permease protein